LALRHSASCCILPNALGRNVAEAAPLVALAIGVPGLRNLVEYEASCCSRAARPRSAHSSRPAGRLKAVLLTYVLTTIADTPTLVLSLNVVFLLLYLCLGAADLFGDAKPAKAI